ncbi:Retrovirus-related Pol polyprotein from transposon opus [Gossypium australe]|uniref:Retrovirus-related Pol polyprotein from transposon opus n=1 Tax=Gossypium australe TaxID=47621 RepID=A0A5B6VYV5_9ROSI|nr:Retrovirus-related Pol polyprotein from transposon opus [Gossypium australe]
MGLFCYQVMPFGLKNVGATYQRLISHGLEVYVDNMLINSESMKKHVRNLSEAFTTLRAHNMKLNPEKCAFDVRAGKFLGFMIWERGIEANSEKIQAIAEMPSPPRELQKKFCIPQARMASKCFPFFKALRKPFSWTEERQTTFEQLKKYLSFPPLLKSPRMGETLYLYLVASEEMIVAFLVKSESTLQYLV